MTNGKKDVTVVLVHGAWVDGARSCAEIYFLQADTSGLILTVGPGYLPVNYAYATGA